MQRTALLAATTALSLALTACGGGGSGSGVGSTPAPQPTQPPAPSPPPTSPPPTTPNPPTPPAPSNPPVTIFPAPTTGQYSSEGVSFAQTDSNSDPNATLAAIAVTPSDQPQIRYSGNGYYEIQIPGGVWSQLKHYSGYADPESTNTMFEANSFVGNIVYLSISSSRTAGYSYSELGGWYSPSISRSGTFAFGTPTLTGGVPLSGAATYSGSIQGSADIWSFDDFNCNVYCRTSVTGTVQLNFDFAAGTLSGEMRPVLNDPAYMEIGLGTLHFKDTVYTSGSTTYSGKFDTAVAGLNFFNGRFTGPNAQETIGNWAFPFVYNIGSSALPADNKVHQAVGAWIAKRP